MRKLYAYLTMTLDGFVDDDEHSLSWANISDDYLEYAVRNLHDIGLLVFGRTTYEGMAEYWTSPDAEAAPKIAALMNSLPKVVVSRTLTTAEWQNTTVLTGDLVAGFGELKADVGKDIAVFGSPTLIASLLDVGVIDEVWIMLMPVLLARGLPLTAELGARVDLELIRSTTYGSGNVLLCYRTT